MRRRSLCNYANASNETSRADAVYQRGQYWIKKNNDRQGDRRRYGVYINDSLIGLGGSLVRVKRFVNDMYKAYPFETDVNEGLTKVKTFARRAQMTLRTEMTPSKAQPKKATPKKKATTKVATSPKNSQASSPKKSSGKLTATRWKKYKTDSARARRQMEDATLRRINAELEPIIEQKPQGIRRLIEQNIEAIQFIESQGRLF